MNEEMFSLLRGFCYRKMRLRDESGIPFPEYIFAKDDGTPIHPDTFSKHLKALFAEIGLPKTYHLHTLRHFFVSTLLHEGVDKNTVTDLAGHGDTSFLERTYCHPQMQLKQEAAKRMKDDYVFRRKGMKLPMTPSTFTWRFKKILKVNDLPTDLNVHSLRHTAASLFIASGTDVGTVAGLLGHSQPSTTLDIYTHAFDKNKKAASHIMQSRLEI